MADISMIIQESLEVKLVILHYTTIFLDFYHLHFPCERGDELAAIMLMLDVASHYHRVHAWGVRSKS